MKAMLIAILCVLALSSCASAATTAYLQDGQLCIYDETSNKMLGVYGEDYNILTIYNGIAYAGGYGGLAAAKLSDGALVYRELGGGSAGDVTNIAVSNKYLAYTTEDGIYILNVPSYSNMRFVSLQYGVTDLEIKSGKLYTDYYIYNVDTLRCLNPGAFLAIYDNQGTWAVERPGGLTYPEVIGFGWPGTEPIVGDWNGDGFKEVGLYNRPGNNFILPDVNGYKVVGLGWKGVTPVTGDFDGDGDDDVGVYDNHGTWALDSDAGVSIVGFGWTGPEPVVGDWNGDGVTEVGLYNRAGNNWLTRSSSEKFDVIGLGWSGVAPIVGNFDSDARDEVAVYAPDTSTFVIEGGKPFVFGKPKSQPIKGDTDYNNIDEVGVIWPDGTVHYNIAKHVSIELIQWPKSTAIGA